MKKRAANSGGGEAVVFILIVLAVIGAAYWYLDHDRRESEKQARAYAEEVSARIVACDEHFLDSNLSAKAQVYYPPSWRGRMFERVRALGKPVRPFNVTGNVKFKWQFFEPQGTFKSQIFYPAMPGYIDLVVAPHGSLWQIDGLNFVWYPAVE
jgi:hypothetical protein